VFNANLSTFQLHGLFRRLFNIERVYMWWYYIIFTYN